ncbi:hypothetical protein [Primorskyibacter sp. S87]|uniref:hypothetical protein n=1 Tax=Primorskyibacter sp. S87 TaxID=3415126 RepID=UPI003C7B47BA
MARKRASAADRKGELIALTRIRLDPPAHIPLTEEEEVWFRAVVTHRSPEDWSSYDLVQVAELAKLETLGEQLRQAADLLGWVDAGTATRKGGPSPEAQMFHQNFGQRMVLRRALKLTNPANLETLHSRGRAFRSAQAIDSYTSEDADDAALLAGGD